MVLLVLVVMLQKSKIEVDCNTVHIFALVKSAGAVKQNSWSEGETKSETGERREICVGQERRSGQTKVLERG